jgi:hypothetical protein
MLVDTNCKEGDTRGKPEHMIGITEIRRHGCVVWKMMMNNDTATDMICMYGTTIYQIISTEVRLWRNRDRRCLMYTINEACKGYLCKEKGRYLLPARKSCQAHSPVEWYYYGLWMYTFFVELLQNRTTLSVDMWDEETISCESHASVYPILCAGDGTSKKKVDWWRQRHPCLSIALILTW